MGIGMSQEECDNSCDREIRMYQKNEERCRFDKKELKMDNEKYKEEIDELTDKFNDFEAECKIQINSLKNKSQRSQRAVRVADRVDHGSPIRGSSVVYERSSGCYKSCGSCDGPGPLDCTSCRDGSNIIDKDGDGAGSCGNEIISEIRNESGSNSGIVRISREGFDNLDSNKEYNNNDNFLLILVMSIIVLLYICK